MAHICSRLRERVHVLKISLSLFLWPSFLSSDAPWSHLDMSLSTPQQNSRTASCSMSPFCLFEKSIMQGHSRSTCAVLTDRTCLLLLYSMDRCVSCLFFYSHPVDSLAFLSLPPQSLCLAAIDPFHTNLNIYDIIRSSCNKYSPLAFFYLTTFLPFLSSICTLDIYLTLPT